MYTSPKLKIFKRFNAKAQRRYKGKDRKKAKSKYFLNFLIFFASWRLCAFALKVLSL